MRKSVVKVLVGLACLPTQTKMNPIEPEKANAFKPNQYRYVLECTDAEKLAGGPFRVVLTCDEPLVKDDGEFYNVGDDLPTHHFSGNKNLPPRKIITMIAGTDLQGQPVVPGGQGSLPHWELMVPGLTAQQVQDRIDANRLAKVKVTTKTETKSAS